MVCFQISLCLESPAKPHACSGLPHVLGGESSQSCFLGRAPRLCFLSGVCVVCHDSKTQTASWHRSLRTDNGPGRRRQLNDPQVWIFNEELVLWRSPSATLWQVSPGGCGFNGATESLEGKRECTGGCRALRRCAQAELRREATQPHLQGRRPLGAGGEHVFIFFPSPELRRWGGDAAEGLPCWGTAATAAATAAAAAANNKGTLVQQAPHL